MWQVLCRCEDYGFEQKRQVASKVLGGCSGALHQLEFTRKDCHLVGSDGSLVRLWSGTEYNKCYVSKRRKLFRKSCSWLGKSLWYLLNVRLLRRLVAFQLTLVYFLRYSKFRHFALRGIRSFVHLEEGLRGILRRLQEILSQRECIILQANWKSCQTFKNVLH